MKLTRLVWHHRKAVLTLVLISCLLGGYFALHLPVAIFPQLTVPRIVISGEAGDIPIEATVTQVTRPLEAAVSTVPGVTRVASTTSHGSNGLDVSFSSGTDMQLALQRVQGKISEIRASLPAGANITAEIINPSIFPIMGYSLSSDHLGLVELRRLAIYTIRPRLARLPGVAQIRITGGDTPEFLLSVRPAALSARGLTLQDVQDAVAKANNISSVGQFDYSYQRYEIFVTGLLRDENDLRNVTVATKGNVPVLVSDIADVSRAIVQPTVLASGDGKPGVVLNVIKQPEANTVQVAQEVRAALLELGKTLPRGVSTSAFYDQSQIVQESEGSVVESIVIGGILALVVLMLFLGNGRAATIVLMLLPLTLLITFSLMKLLGETLNIMTLGALAVALGLVIDDGIVVVENMFHELEQGHSRSASIVAGLQAITPAMVGSSLTTMMAFLPLTFLGGVTGQFFAPLAIVMVATLFVSLVLALLLTPILADYLLPLKAPAHGTSSTRVSTLQRFTRFFPSLFDRVAHFYGRVLGWALRHPLVIFLLLMPVALGSYGLFTNLKTGFFPEFDEGAFVIDYKMPAGTSLAETDRVCRQVEGLLGKTPEVAAWSRLSGARSGSGLELAEQNQGDILVRLNKQRTRASDEVMSDVRSRIEGTQPKLQVDLIQILQDGIGDIAGSPSPIEVKIFGDDTAVLTKVASQANDIISKVPGVVDSSNGVVESGPSMTVRVDGARASRYGLTVDAVTSAAQAALRGSVATTLQQGEEGIDVRVRAAGVSHDLDPQSLPDVSIAAPALLSATSSTRNGGTVPLRSLATLELQPGTPLITRENQQQMVAVTARLEGRDLGSGVRDVQNQLAQKLKLPPGYRLEYGGLYASQQESFAQLGTVLLLAFLLVTTLLVVQFRSFRQALALFFAAILSLFGVLLGLFVTKTPLNISSFTGAIMIVGVVTENGIVLFDFFNQLREREPHRPLIELMAEAGQARLRPILMTTMGAILALFPLALGLGAGAAMQKPLAVAVIGGLSVSTLFTLIVAPVLYVASENLRGPVGGRMTTAEADFTEIERELEAPSSTR
jgi:CzcA family heavy metal efflux pump